VNLLAWRSIFIQTPQFRLLINKMAATSPAEIRAVIAAAAPLSDAPLDVAAGSTLYKGGCHCGAVRFEVTVASDAHHVLDCNCSMCVKKGFLHLIATPATFRLRQGQDQLSLYTFNTHAAKHLFCSRCGICPFYRPRSHPEGFSVNLLALDDYENIKKRFEVRPYDGANWENARAELTKVEQQAAASK
jgi:hypothetical protein